MYVLPLPVRKLRSIFPFWVGAHSLPVEQGRIEMPQVPRHLRRCTFCATNAIGDERHCVFDCPHFQGLRQQHAQIFQDSHGAMRSLMWHKDQKSVCAACQREREREIHYVHWASKAYEDESVFMTAADSMTDSSSYAFAGCMDVVNFLLLLCACIALKALPHNW